MNRFVFALLAAWTLLNSQAVAQIQGNQNFVRLPGAIDAASRMTGFGYNNQYYIAYNDNSNGLSGGEHPSVYYGNVTSSGSNLPVPGFQDASKVAIPGLGGNTHLFHQAAAVLAGAPYLFQFTCQRRGSPTLLSANYEKMIAPVISNTAPTFTTAGNVSSSIVSALGNVFDVAAATLNSKLYVFVLRGNGSNPDSISVLSYGGQGSGGPRLESSYTFADTNSNIQIQGIDATNVTLASGEQAIVVCSPFVGSGQAQVKAWLFTGNSGGRAVTITPYSLVNPSYANYPAAIRMAYGPAQGTQKVNSLTLFYAALDGGFFGVSGRIYTAQLVLPPSLESGSLSQAGTWTRLTGIWQNSRGDLSQYPYNWTAFSVSLPSSANTNGYSNVDQYITLVEKGTDNGLYEHRNSFVTSLALQLQIDQGTAGEEWISGDVSDLSPADQVAAVESWNLLGIITGLPPLPSGTTVTYRAPILELKYSTSESASKQVSDTSVVTAGASADVSDLTASADYTYSSKQGTTSSSTISLALNAEFHSAASTNTYDKYADTGFLIVSQPNLLTGNYHVYSYDGTTSLGISTVTISVGSTSFAAIPFRLTDPRYEVPGEPACIYDTFPTVANDAAAVIYPMTTDIAGWEKQVTLNDVQPLFPSLNPQIINATYTNSVQLRLTSSSQNTFSAETSNTIDVGAEVSFLGIGAEGETSIQLTSQTSVAFSSSQTNQITYPQLQQSKGYSQIQLQVMFDRLIDNPTTPPQWMPTVFTGSKPWILTWKVLSATPGLRRPPELR